MSARIVHEWGSLPAEGELLLRTGNLPYILPRLHELLAAWCVRQSAEVINWVRERKEAYFAAGKRDYPEELEMVASLDLLEWRCGHHGNAAIAWLEGIESAHEHFLKLEAQGL